MGNLFDLIAGLNKPAAEQPALRLVESTSQQAAADAPPAAPAPAAEAVSEPQRIVSTAATASPAWLAVRDQFHNHIFGDCPGCHPPTGRYCPTGAELRATYDTTPMELTP